jgi:hypothetical protein
VVVVVVARMLTWGMVWGIQEARAVAVVVVEEAPEMPVLLAIQGVLHLLIR